MEHNLIRFDFGDQPIRVIMCDRQPWWVFDTAAEFLQSPMKLPPYFGCVYALEFGGHLKIGQSCAPFQRVRALASQAKNYGPGHVGALAVSQPHTNYAQNERTVHAQFAPERVKGELFQLTLQDFLERVSGIEFRDESARLAAKSQAFISHMKTIVTSGPATGQKVG